MLIKRIAFVLLLIPTFCFADVSVAEVKSTLESIQKLDQEFRQQISKKLNNGFNNDSPEIQNMWKQQAQQDKKNQDTISTILKSHGWPKKQNFPEGWASQTAWLVIQHAPLEYQQEHYDYALLAYFNGNLDSWMFAMLLDKMRTNEGKSQLFGSQLMDNAVTGKPEFLEIIDKENINTRRNKVGLPPIEEYAKRYGINWTSQANDPNKN